MPIHPLNAICIKIILFILKVIKINPAAGSPTTTMLRLRPSHWFKTHTPLTPHCKKKLLLKIIKSSIMKS
jgi:hypothetical protein